jgi:8-oxo-dGTP pyrophosphatase MutT (NUDIX family)
MSTIGRFYGAIFALIWSPANYKYLLLKRSEEKDYASGIWECVTGRVDQGEGFEAALHREVREEIGVEVQFEFMIGTTHFYRGPEKPAYEMIGLVCGCSIPDPEAIQISAEHSEYRWVSFDEVDDVIGDRREKTEWIKEIIQRAEVIKKLLPPEMGNFIKERGLEVI